jgi:hypothetical protein
VEKYPNTRLLISIDKKTRNGRCKGSKALKKQKAASRAACEEQKILKPHHARNSSFANSVTSSGSAMG